eukprot:198479_1
MSHISGGTGVSGKQQQPTLVQSTKTQPAFNPLMSKPACSGPPNSQLNANLSQSKPEKSKKKLSKSSVPQSKKPKSISSKSKSKQTQSKSSVSKPSRSNPKQSRPKSRNSKRSKSKTEIAVDSVLASLNSCKSGTRRTRGRPRNQRKSGGPPIDSILTKPVVPKPVKMNKSSKIVPQKRPRKLFHKPGSQSLKLPHSASDIRVSSVKNQRKSLNLMSPSSKPYMDPLEMLSSPLKSPPPTIRRNSSSLQHQNESNKPALYRKLFSKSPRSMDISSFDKPAAAKPKRTARTRRQKPQLMSGLSSENMFAKVIRNSLKTVSKTSSKTVSKTKSSKAKIKRPSKYSPKPTSQMVSQTSSKKAYKNASKSSS